MEIVAGGVFLFLATVALPALLMGQILLILHVPVGGLIG
jgi:hypothetical protein